MYTVRHETALEHGLDNVWLPVTCLVIGLWTVTVIQGWKSTQHELAYLWDMYVPYAASYRAVPLRPRPHSQRHRPRHHPPNPT